MTQCAGKSLDSNDEMIKVYLFSTPEKGCNASAAPKAKLLEKIWQANTDCDTASRQPWSPGQVKAAQVKG